MRRRYSSRVDNNQGEIVDALRALGASVQSLAALGAGVPDLLVGFRLRTFIVEVKNAQRRQSKLTEDQADWIIEWRGTPVHIVATVDDAIALLRSEP